MTRQLLFSALVLGTASAVGYAQLTPADYNKQVDYLRSLSAPVDPTPALCASLNKAFDERRTTYDAEHEKCLAAYPEAQQRQGSCSRAECQPLHSLRDLTDEMKAAQSKLCNQRLAIAQAKQREWDERVRASQEYYRKQIEQSQKERNEAWLRDEGERARAWLKQQGQQGQQAARASTDPPAPRPTTDPAFGPATPPSRASAPCRVFFTAETCTGMAESIDYWWTDDPNAEATRENAKNLAAARADPSGLRAGLTSPAVGSAVSGASLVGGVIIGVGIEALNDEVAVGVGGVLQGSRSVRAAERVLMQDEWTYAGCSTLSNEPARQRLAADNKARYLELWNSCNRK